MIQIGDEVYFTSKFSTIMGVVSQRLDFPEGALCWVVDQQQGARLVPENLLKTLKVHEEAHHE